MREVNGVPVAIVGQAFPTRRSRNPRHFVPGVDLRHPGRRVAEGRDAARAAARRWSCCCPTTGWTSTSSSRAASAGIDAILGGHTHDGVPAPIEVAQPGGRTLVTNAGSNGKFLGTRLSTCAGGKVAGFRYRLLPVFANLLPADAGHGSR
jgi:sulfur-oxidizing protein SoxB